MTNTVLILGVSPSSIFLAGLLKQAGISVRIFNISESDNIPTGVTLMPALVEQFRQLGIMNSVSEHAEIIKRYKITDKDLRSRYEADTFQSEPFTKQAILGIDSNKLQSIVCKQYEIEVEPLDQVDKISETDSGVVLTCKGAKIEGSQLIVCDPSIRNLTPLKTSEQISKWIEYKGICNINFAEINEQSIIESATAKHYFRLIPVHENQKCWITQIPAKQAAGAANLIRDRLLSEFKGFYPNVTDVIYSTKSHNITQAYSKTMTYPAQPYIGRVLLFGKALVGSIHALTLEESTFIMDAFFYLKEVQEVGLDKASETFFKSRRNKHSELLQLQKTWEDKVRPAGLDLFRSKKALQQALHYKA